MKIEDNIRIFIQDKVKSFIRWDLIRFFHDNPHTKDTAENIANFMARDPQRVESELLELVNADILKIEHISDTQLFFLSTEADIREIIDQFMNACHDREFRVHAINYVVQQIQKN